MSHETNLHDVLVKRVHQFPNRFSATRLLLVLALLGLLSLLSLSLTLAFSLASLAFSLSLALRGAVRTALTGHVDGDLLLRVLRVGLELVLDLGSLLEGLEAILGGLLDLSVVDEDIVTLTLNTIRGDEANTLVVQPLGDGSSLSLRHLGKVGEKLKRYSERIDSS